MVRQGRACARSASLRFVSSQALDCLTAKPFGLPAFAGMAGRGSEWRNRDFAQALVRGEWRIGRVVRFAEALGAMEVINRQDASEVETRIERVFGAGPRDSQAVRGDAGGHRRLWIGGVGTGSEGLRRRCSPADVRLFRIAQWLAVFRGRQGLPERTYVEG